MYFFGYPLFESHLLGLYSIYPGSLFMQDLYPDGFGMLHYDIFPLISLLDRLCLSIMFSIVYGTHYIFRMCNRHSYSRIIC